MKEGSLFDFQRLKITSYEVNRPLFRYEITRVTSKLKKQNSAIVPKGLTLSMMSVLFERSDILEYILINLKPDLSIFIDGYNILHLAAITEDHKCLELLLQCQYIREILNLGVNFGDHQRVNGDTTALHIAVSNRRYKSVFALLSDPKPVIYLANPNSDEELILPDIHILSASGSTALHIACFLQDINMIRLLLAFGSDPYVCNSSGKDVPTFVQELQIPESQRILDLLSSPAMQDPSEVIDMIYPKAKEPEVQSVNYQIPNNGIMDTLNVILSKLASLEARMDRIEKNNIESQVIASESKCINCLQPGKICPLCHLAFCEKCAPKSVHSCMKFEME